MCPKVSVIIPVYNMERFLAAALTSITTQTLREIEIICINDGSTDSSLDILVEWQARDSRIQIIDKANAGVGKARNDGILRATGEFLNFFDPDDLYYSQNSLLLLYQTAIDYHVKAVGGKIKKVDERGSSIFEEEARESFHIDFSQRGALSYAEWQYDYGYCGFLFDRQMILENKLQFPALSRFQDPPFFVRALAAADQIYLLNEPTYSYRLWGQMKAPKPQKTMDMIDGMLLNLVFAREKGFAKLYYLTAMRLQKEVSYVLQGQLEMDGITPVLMKYFAAYATIDCSWLVENGYDTMALSTPDCLAELLAAYTKYQKLRRNPILRAINKLTSRGK